MNLNKEKIKEILLKQLNECKIEPMQYVKLNSYVEKLSDEKIKNITELFGIGNDGKKIMDEILDQADIEYQKRYQVCKKFEQDKLKYDICLSVFILNLCEKVEKKILSRMPECNGNKKCKTTLHVGLMHIQRNIRELQNHLKDLKIKK